MKFNTRITKQPRKKRKALYQAPLHVKAKLFNARLSDTLKTQLKKNTLKLKKGFKVKIITGKNKKAEGKITSIDYKKSRVFVDTNKTKNARGKEKFVGIHPSNLLILETVEKK